MSLREQIAKDTALFFSRDEFSDLHSFAGRTLSILVDEDQLQQYALKGLPGFFEADKLLYIRAVDLEGIILRVEAPIIFDGAQYIITRCVMVDGIWEVAMRGILR